MTQEVQPLTWQKRTNIEEHQQFFSKINEIIDNLAPTVDEAEAALAQASQALDDAAAAIATANAASAAADAAAQSAEDAADVVAGYNARLSAVEADYLKKTGPTQNVTSQITVPTSSTGARDTQIANGTRIQNDLDAYAPMLRNTGNQSFTGIKTCERNAATTSSGASSSLVDKFLNVDMAQPITSNRYAFFPMMVDANGLMLAGIRIQLSSGNHVVFTLFTSKNDGTRTGKLLAEYDRTNDVWL